MNLSGKCPTCGFEPLPSITSTIILDGSEFSLFKDYLHQSGKVGNLATLPFNERVKYLEARAKLIVLEPLEELLHLENSQLTRKYHLLNIVTLVCCGIEALGHYLLPERRRRGKKRTTTKPREYFKEFVKVFMNSEFQRNSAKADETYSDYVYDYFRNGLAHGFCIQRGGIERKQKRYFDYDSGRNRLIMDVDFLIDDFKQAFVKFFQTLQSEGENGSYGKTFEKRFKKILLTP